MGTAASKGSDTAPLKTVNSRLRFANVFATRFDPDVTDEQLLGYLKKRLPGQDLKVETVPTRYNTYASFHITSKCQDPSVFMNCDLWPKGAYVRWWRENRKVNNGEQSMRLEDQLRTGITENDLGNKDIDQSESVEGEEEDAEATTGREKTQLNIQESMI